MHGERSARGMVPLRPTKKDVGELKKEKRRTLNPEFIETAPYGCPHWFIPSCI